MNIAKRLVLVLGILAVVQSLVPVAAQTACEYPKPAIPNATPFDARSMLISYSLPGFSGFLTVPTASGTAYRTANFSGEVTRVTSTTGVLTDSFTGNIVPGTEYTTTTTVINGARGARRINADGTIADTSAFYGSATTVDNGSTTASSSYEYKASDANSSSYFQVYGQYAALADSAAARPDPVIPYHKTAELYITGARHTLLQFDVSGNVTSAVTTNTNTGATWDAYTDTNWGPLVRTTYEGTSGTSRIDLLDAFEVATALANPTTGVAKVFTSGTLNFAYVQSPNWQMAQPTNGIYYWVWSSQSASVVVSFPLICPGKYRLVMTYTKSPLSGPGQTVVFSTDEEVTFDTAQNASVDRVVPLVDPAVGVTESNRRYTFTGASVEKICEGRSPGDGVTELGSVRAAFYLGKQSGWIRLESDSLGWWTTDPNRLNVPFQSGVNEWIESVDGQTIQYRSRETFVVFVVADDWNSYRMDFYQSTQVGAKSTTTGFYALSGTPFASYTLSNPDPDNLHGGKLRIAKTLGNNLTAVEYSYNYATVNGVQVDTWTYTQGGTLQKLTKTWSLNQTKLVETFDLAGNRVGAVFQRYTRMNIPGATQILTQEVLDPDGSAKTTSYDYYYDPAISYSAGLAANPGYGQLKQVTRSDGSWEYYIYDSSRKVTKTLRPWINTAPTTDESRCRVSQLVRSSMADADGDGLSEQMETNIELIQGRETSRTYRIFWSKPAALGTELFKKQSQIRCFAAGAVWNAVGNLTTTTYTYANAPFYGETRYVLNPDGTATSCVLSIDSQGNRTTIVRSGQPNAGLTDIVDGRATVSVVNSYGGGVSEATYDIASGLALDGWTATQFDSAGRSTRRSYSDGTFVLRSYACCGLESETDREGITTNYTYDSGRVVLMTCAGIATRYEYDAAGRQVAQYRRASDGTEIRLRKDTYNLAGDLVSTVDAGNRTTRYARSVDATGQSTVVTTYPDSGTRIEVFARDGSLLSVSGTAAAPRQYEYGADGDGPFAKEINVGSGGELTEWSKSYTDFLGRGYRVQYPDGAVTQSFFNALGQLVKQVDPDGIAKLFAYNTRGELEYTAVDVNGNEQIDFNGADRVTRTRRDVITSHATTVERIITTVLDAGGPHDIAVVESSSNSRQIWQTVHGLTTQTVIAFNGSGGRTETRTAPDGTVTTQTLQMGKLTSNVVSHPALGTLASATYTYDVNGRLQSVTDGRNGTSTFTYFDDDQIRTTAEPSPSPNLPPPVTVYAYDGAGRVSTVTAPDGGVVNTTYYPTGQIRRTWGVRTFPTEYTYDSQGRVKSLATWQDFMGDTGKAVTTWNYDSQRGWLANKRHADNTGPSYTYTPAGRLRTRTWARGVVTTYAYNSAGDFAGISYSDTTPPVSFTYDALGRLASKTDGTGTCVYAYQGFTFQPVTETHTTGLIGGMSVVRTFDSLLRLGSLSAFYASSSVSQTGCYYDAASRLQTVTAGANTATYAYEPGSSLVAGLIFRNNGTTRLTTTKSYDRLNRLTSVVNSSSNSQPLSYAYTYNSANQRTRATREDNSFWNYGYDTLGQVTSGRKFLAADVLALGHDFTWTFDDIGNRKTSVNNGRTAIYTANPLNQYTQRTVPGAIDVLGSATADATVTVNLQSTQRQSAAFYRALTVDNSTAPQNQLINVVGVKNNVGPNGEDAMAIETRSAFLAKSPEMFSHDPDGNLTQDGRWSYTWDAENRLIAMETNPSVANVVPALKQRLEFAYDAQGRRIEKKVLGWAAAGNQWSVVSHTRFLYDGWNMLAEFAVTGGPASMVPLRTYVWGLDVSGSFQGAGGVGGLLSVTDAATSTTHFGCFDGNGNIAGLVNAATGALSAQYDYNAFGEPVLTIGIFASTNPFGFSTKYADSETGHLCYGYRYFIPGTGRWLNRDPYGEEGGANLYQFVANAPTSWCDPLGLALYAFDGTNNDGNRDRWDNPKAENGPTNVKILYDIYVGNRYYAHGVGTRDGVWNLFGLAGGLGGKSREANALRAAEEFMKDGDTIADIIGFSRGAAEARDFANQLKRKFPCITIRWIGIFDTVASFGLGGNGVDIGYDFGIPAGTGSVFHLTGGGERRHFFPLMSINIGSGTRNPNPNYAEISIPGAVHSDIGGGYRENRGLANLALVAMWGDGKSHDVPFGDIPSMYFNFENTPHDSRWINDKIVEAVTRGPRQRKIFYAP